MGPCLFALRVFSALPLIYCISFAFWFLEKFSQQKTLSELEGCRRGKATRYFPSLTMSPLDSPGCGSNSHYVASPQRFQHPAGIHNFWALIIFSLRIIPPAPGMVVVFINTCFPQAQHLYNQFPSLIFT